MGDKEPEDQTRANPDTCPHPKKSEYYSKWRDETGCMRCDIWIRKGK